MGYMKKFTQSPGFYDIFIFSLQIPPCGVCPMLAEDYLPVILFVIIGILVPAISFYLTRFFRFEKAEKEKEETYECGEIPEGEARIQFNFQYYIFALTFVVFDVVAVLLIPWAISYDGLTPGVKIASLLVVSIFLMVTLVAVIYSLRKERRIWI